jgi:protein O-mannose beta-1,4-N-acetylglucosaminyltransferase
MYLIFRQCKITNLYFLPGKNQFFIIINENSALVNVPKIRGFNFIDASSLNDHPDFYWSFYQFLNNNNNPSNQKILDIVKPSYLFSRVNTENIMHCIHDDFIGLYHTIRRFTHETAGHRPEYASFQNDHIIQFLDSAEKGNYDSIYTLLTDYPLRYLSDLKSSEHITRFRVAHVGNAKLANWYQYGFTEPQGPIKNKEVSGYHVRQVTNYILHKLGIKDSEEQDMLGIFSRTSNRLILNEDSLLSQVERKFQLKGIFIRNEDQTFLEQVKLMRRTKVAIGMHGSLLIMSMFMKPGSVLIEMYPFAVPAENYTPYKTLCNLPGYNIIYKYWTNRYSNNNFMHPDRPQEAGGIKHLPAETVLKIIKTETVPSHLCCSDPYWLFRIYQDTLVKIDEILSLVKASLEESNKLPSPGSDLTVMEASSVTQVQCASRRVDGVKKVIVTWGLPWNRVHPDYYLIWEHFTFKSYTSHQQSLEISEPSLEQTDKLRIWIRGVKNEIGGFNAGPFMCDI